MKKLVLRLSLLLLSLFVFSSCLDKLARLSVPAGYWTDISYLNETLEEEIIRKGIKERLSDDADVKYGYQVKTDGSLNRTATVIRFIDNSILEYCRAHCYMLHGTGAVGKQILTRKTIRSPKNGLTYTICWVMDDSPSVYTYTRGDGMLIFSTSVYSEGKDYFLADGASMERALKKEDYQVMSNNAPSTEQIFNGVSWTRHGFSTSTDTSISFDIEISSPGNSAISTYWKYSLTERYFYKMYYYHTMDLETPLMTIQGNSQSIKKSTSVPTSLYKENITDKHQNNYTTYQTSESIVFYIDGIEYNSKSSN